MRIAKIFSIVFVLILCIAACNTAKEPQKKENKVRIVEFNEFMEAVKDQDVSLIIAYNKNAAEPVVIASGPNIPKPTKIPGPVDIKILEEKLGKKLSDERYIELKSTTIFSVYGSPGGQLVPMGGDYIFVPWAQP